MRVHFGCPITLDQMAGLDQERVTALIRERMLECQAIANTELARDMGRKP
jgi:hypothetical protein